MVKQTLDYSSDGSTRRGRVTVWVASAFCIVAIALVFIDTEIASIPGFISACLSFVAYLRRRKVTPRGSLDTQVKIVTLLSAICILPMVWYTWTISGWAQPASSQQADELMDRGKVILEACRTYASKHGGAYPKDLSVLIREGLVPVTAIGPCASTLPSDAELRTCSDFLYFGTDLDGSWIPSRQVILLLSRNSFAKYGGSGRPIGYGDGQSLFCFDRDLPEEMDACNRERKAHGLPPIKG